MAGLVNAKVLLGAVLTGVALFIFGFLYWAINPLPYLVWNPVEDMAATQMAAAKLFPQDGVYFLPGGANDPAALELLKQGPSVYVTIDHSPVAGSDPSALGVGLLHNIVSALLLVLLLQRVSGLGNRVRAALLTSVVAIFIINGSEVVWWQQPLSWVIHQMIYYVLYFLLAALILHKFLPPVRATPEPMT